MRAPAVLLLFWLAAGALPAIDPAGLFADYGPFFLQPREPEPGDSVTVRLQTAAGDAGTVEVQVRPAGGGTVQTYAMAKESSGVVDVWKGSFPAGTAALEYWFRIRQGNDTLYYNAFGSSPTRPDRLNFRIIPGFHVPDWAQGVTWYQIFPDRFRDGDPANNVRTGEYNYYGPVQAKAWGDSPAGGNDFFGGDLGGIRDRLAPYLQQQLGIEALYLNPVFQSPSNHKYDTQDYRNVDPHFGGNEALEALTAAARQDGDFPGDYPVRIMLDGVFNHCGDWHFWFDRPGAWPGTTGAFESKSSPYFNFFTFYGWPGNYATFGVSFGGHFDSMPKLNFANPELKNEIYAGSSSIARQWLGDPWRVDGWRLDVGQEPGENGTTAGNHAIWAEFRQAVKAARPDALITGEYWGVATSWLAGDQWDGAMNYNGFTEPLGRWLLKTDPWGDAASITTGDLHNWLQGTLADNPGPARLAMLNSLSTHDIPRVWRRAGGNVKLVKAATAFLLTYPGSPCIYYGDEAGLDGGADPDNRRCFPWDELDQPARAALREFHRTMIRLRREHAALRTGSYRELLADEQTGTFAFARFDGNGTFITLARRKGTAAANLTLPVRPLQIADGSGFTDVFTGQDYPVTGGMLDLGSIPGEEFRVLSLTRRRGASTRFQVESGRQTVLQITSPDGQLKAGWARIAFDQPGQAGLLACAENILYTAGGIPVTEATLYPAEPATAFQLLANFQRNQLNPGVALTNPGSGTASVTLKLTDRDGTVYRQEVELAAGHSYVRFLDGIFSGLPDAVAGVLEATASAPVAATQLSIRFNSRGEFLLSALPVVITAAAPSGEEQILNYFALGAGYTTGLRLTAPGAATPLSGTITCYAEDGTPLPVEWR